MSGPAAKLEAVRSVNEEDVTMMQVKHCQQPV